MIWILLVIAAIAIWRSLYLERTLRRYEIAILKAQGKL